MQVQLEERPVIQCSWGAVTSPRGQALLVWLAIMNKCIDHTGHTDCHTTASCLIRLYRRRRTRGAVTGFTDLAMLITRRLTAMYWKPKSLPVVERWSVETLKRSGADMVALRREAVQGQHIAADREGLIDEMQ
ncbi:hypothetical protein NDU88_003186 [Pleurodeles waltl]|uniref:Uncharacterized protein n=1 Tax=Pleurodeles waltl TaxID=8319 RepID=A0AAV7RHT2_PLEWA|nr:hypothetical protein NDU88_003186 [Pleurodeles waltl]